MSKEIVLKVSNLTKTYGQLRAVDQVSLEVYRGDVYGFLGPNGSGKTTTIRSILGLITPTQGQVEICGHNIAQNPEGALASVGAVVENPTMYQYMSARNNLYLFADIQGVLRKEADELLEVVGLSERADDKVAKYSLGMKQRLGLAQALLGKPALVILDEPTNGLDPHGTVEIRELIKHLSQKKNITFFVSSHQLHEVELICNRVSVLRRGRVVSEGYVKDLLKSDKTQIQLEVSDLKVARELLVRQDWIHDAQIQEDKLFVTAEPDKSADITKLLVGQDILVNSISQVPKTLETFFMDITAVKEGEESA